MVGPGLLPGRALSSSDMWWFRTPWTRRAPGGPHPPGERRPRGRGAAVPAAARGGQAPAPGRAAVGSLDRRRAAAAGRRPVGGVLAVHPPRVRDAAPEVARLDGAAHALGGHLRDVPARPRARHALRRGADGRASSTGSTCGSSRICRTRTPASGRCCPGCCGRPSGSSGAPTADSVALLGGARRRCSTSPGTPRRASTSCWPPSRSSRCASVAGARARRVRAPLLAMAAALVAGTGLAAVMLAPFGELLLHSADLAERSGTGIDKHVDPSLPARLLHVRLLGAGDRHAAAAAPVLALVVRRRAAADARRRGADPAPARRAALDRRLRRRCCWR